MKRTSWLGRSILLFGFLGLLSIAWAQPESRTYLLRGTQGELPSDAGDESTKVNIGENKELGGKCIKVDLHNSIGVSKAKVNDWKPYTALAFDIVAEKDLTLILTIRHAKTKDFASRVDREFQLKPGKNTIRFTIDSLVNNDKSAPDLGSIVRWYIALHEEKDKGAVIYLGDVWLEGGSAVAVDPNLIKSDPARLARIKANKMPAINQPVMFDTPEADAICSALEVFPANNPWNLIVEEWPVHANSQSIINSIGADKPLRYNPDMGFILVPPNQKKIEVNITEYAEESDKGPYPVPNNVPIEGWPAAFRELPKGQQPTLDDIQRDKKNEGGDRHAIVLDPTRGLLYEFYVMKKSDKGWSAESAAIFDLKSNKLRPDGWTSADAAGLPIFPAVVRYDELKRGVIDHALRVTVVKSRKAYVYPATHYASKLTDENLPRMGERLRLKKDVDISKFSPEVQTILKALQRYGMFVADNGIDWAISVSPDPRIKSLHEELRRLKGSDFEVIVAPPGYEPASDEKKPAPEPTPNVEQPVIKADLYVDDDNSGAQDGTSLHPYKTVQQAIDAAKTNSVIAVACGTYPENIKVQEKVVRIYGGYVGGTKADYEGGKAGNFTLRDSAVKPSHLKGNGKDSVVSLQEAGASIVDGFLISGGGRSTLADSLWVGGGVYIYGGSPTISNNVIEKNQTCPSVKQEQEKLGGGIYASASSVSILNNIIRNNVSGRGAGIPADGPKLVIRGNTVQNNIGVSDHGGGVYLFSPNAEFSHNRVEGNEIGRELGYGWGGGIIVFNKGGKYKMSHNVFTGNYAPSLGSAVFVDEGADATMDHDLIYANADNPTGEAPVVAPIYVDGADDKIGSTLYMNHVTIADHSTKSSASSYAIGVTGKSKVTVKNSILWNNGGNDISVDNISSATATYTISQKELKGIGNISKDPLFVNSAGSDYRLSSIIGHWNQSKDKSGTWIPDMQHSPGIDAADPASPFDREPNPNGGRANLGADGNTARASKSKR